MSVTSVSMQSSRFDLAADPALPQRDLLLDDRQMAGRLSLLLSRHGSSVIDGCEKQRIKYRIGESLRVLYRVSVNGRPRLIAAKAFAEPRTSGLPEHAELLSRSRGSFSMAISERHSGIALTIARSST